MTTPDPDDLSIEVPRVNAVSSTEASSSAGTSSVPRVRISAISELKEFSGKDFDEEKARSWLNKVRSAFARDQAPNSEKCIIFSNLLVGPARNWYQPLGRTTRSKWNDLLGDFRAEYCGLVVSLALPRDEANGREAAGIPSQVHSTGSACEVGDQDRSDIRET